MGFEEWIRQHLEDPFNSRYVNCSHLCEYVRPRFYPVYISLLFGVRAQW